MKHAFLYLFVLVSCSLTAQTNKHTEKLKEWFEAEKFKQVVDYKKGKTRKLEAEAIFYMARAHFMLDNDKKAILYYNRAIKKGPVTANMHYFKAVSEYYQKEYENAITSLDKAIAMDSVSPYYYFLKGNVYASDNQYDSAEVYLKKASKFKGADASFFEKLAVIQYEQQKYSEAIRSFKTAILRLGDEPDKYKEYNYNVALLQQLNEEYRESEVTLNTHLSKFENDFHARAKLIQVLNAQEKYEKAKSHIPNLYTAHEKDFLPSNLSESFCFAQYKHDTVYLMFYEHYQLDSSKALPRKYSIYVEDSLKNTLSKLYAVPDSGNGMLYYLVHLKNDTLFSYGDSSFSSDISYSRLKSLSIQVLENEVLPISTLPGLNNWLKEQHIARFGDKGTSFETAIEAESISFEYDWIRENYPGSRVLQQALVFNNEKPYDILTVKTAEGIKLQLYFDISSFFGKGFK